MRTLISHSRTVNLIRLALLKDTCVQLNAHMNLCPHHPALLCMKLTKAAERLKDREPVLNLGPGLSVRVPAKQFDLEAFNLRAYLAQELADGHSGEKQRNMASYLFYAGLMNAREFAFDGGTLTANLARGAWLDKMIERLTETFKETNHAT